MGSAVAQHFHRAAIVHKRLFCYTIGNDKHMVVFVVWNSACIG